MSVIPKKVIACDLDGTLTESKSTLSEEMAEVLRGVLRNHFLAIVSGGAFSQFKKQFLSNFFCEPKLLQNLFLFPTNGSACYTYKNGEWKQMYMEAFAPEETEKIISALNRGINESGLDLSGAYGEIIEDRQSQITFSGKGQEAPIDVKKVWDPDGAKRRKIVEIIKKEIPQFEIRINSVSSIDITRMGIYKAYAMQKIMDLLKVSDQDIIFIGDALFRGGNDSAVKKTDVDYIQEDGPDETIELLRQYV